VEKEKTLLAYDPKLVFFGSSTIRLWESLYQDFKPFSPINLGFGGSTLEACVFFFKRLMYQLNPAHLVVYAGDNDLGDGKSPDEVHTYFLELTKCIDKLFKDLPVTFISIKPSITRWEIRGKIEHTNFIIKETIKGKPFVDYLDLYSSMLTFNGVPNPDFYVSDGLHLSKNGYQLWKRVVLTHISSKYDLSLTLMN
jgi:hypothetical protein